MYLCHTWINDLIVQNMSLYEHLCCQSQCYFASPTLLPPQLRTKVSFTAVLGTSCKWQFLHINRQFNNTNDKRGINGNGLTLWQAHQSLYRSFCYVELHSPVLSKELAVRIKIKPLTRQQAGLTELQLSCTKIDYFKIHCTRQEEIAIVFWDSREPFT